MKITALFIFLILLVFRNESAEGRYWFCKLFEGLADPSLKISVKLVVLLSGEAFLGSEENIPTALRDQIAALSDATKTKKLIDNFDPRRGPLQTGEVEQTETPIEVTGVKVMHESPNSIAELKQASPVLDAGELPMLMVATEQGNISDVLKDEALLDKYPAIIVNEFDGSELKDTYIAVNRDLLSKEELAILNQATASGLLSTDRVVVKQSQLFVAIEVEITVFYSIFITLCRRPATPTTSTVRTYHPHTTKKLYTKPATVRTYHPHTTKKLYTKPATVRTYHPHTTRAGGGMRPNQPVTRTYTIRCPPPVTFGGCLIPCSSILHKHSGYLMLSFIIYYIL